MAYISQRQLLIQRLLTSDKFKRKVAGLNTCFFNLSLLLIQDSSLITHHMNELLKSVGKRIASSNCRTAPYTTSTKTQSIDSKLLTFITNQSVRKVGRSSYGIWLCDTLIILILKLCIYLSMLLRIDSYDDQQTVLFDIIFFIC